MMLKLFTYGCAKYWGDSFNRFDGLIVISSLVDVAFEFGREFFAFLPPDAPAFTVLRAFRLLRVFRLLRSWQSLQRLLGALMDSLAQLFYLMVLLFLFLFIFALLGMQLFGGRYTPEAGFDELPRANFDSITFSLISVFVVGNIEAWDTVWIDTNTAAGGWSGIFFVSLTFVCSYIMINLVVATLISTFDAQAARERKRRLAQEAKELAEKGLLPLDSNRSVGGGEGGGFFKKAIANADAATANDGEDGRRLPGIPEVMPGSGDPWLAALASMSDEADGAGACSPAPANPAAGSTLTALPPSQALPPSPNLSPTAAPDLQPPSPVLSASEAPDLPPPRPLAPSPAMAAKLPTRPAAASPPPSPPQNGGSEGAYMPLEDEPEGRTSTGEAGYEEEQYEEEEWEDGEEQMDEGEDVGYEELRDEDDDEEDAPPRDFASLGTEAEGQEDPNDYSLFLLSPAHPLRRAAHALVVFRINGTAFSFDNLIILFIIASSVAMAYDSCDVTPGSELALKLQQIDKVAMAVFVSELVAKVIAYGLAFTPHAYLKDGWNRLDFFIVGASIMSMLGDSSPAFRVLRVLRVLRPLRLISRFSGMRLAIQLLLKAMPRVGDVFVVYLLFLSIFAILGVQLFAGQLQKCHTLEGASREACPPAADGIMQSWGNHEFGSFDNFLASALLLFEMSTLEGWLEVMWAAIDATDVDQAPVRDNKPARALFFVLWIVLGSMMLLNLFVGVLVNVFADMKRKQEDGEEKDGAGVMTDEQKQYVESMESMLELRPKRVAPRPSHSPCRARCYDIVHAPRFDNFVLGVIMFNTVVIALDGYGVGVEGKNFLSFLNFICTVVFVLEAVVKITAVSFPFYIRDAWNVFDFVVVSFSLADFFITAIASATGETSNPTLIRILRVVRVTRILRTLRVIRTARSLRLLLSMLVLSLPALSNILGIFMIILFMYSLLAMQLFGEVAHGPFISNDANFCSYPVATLTLFRCSTGEAWNGLMHDSMVTPEFGGCSLEDGNCGSWLAVPFFVSFVLLTTFIVLKMMIALILENYLKTLRRDRSNVQPEDATAFLEAWSVFDPEGTGWLHCKDLIEFIFILPPPLGLSGKSIFGRTAKRLHAQRYILQMDLHPTISPVDGALVVPFKQLLATIVRDAYFDSKSGGGLMRKVQSWDNILTEGGLKDTLRGQKLIEALVEQRIVPTATTARIAGAAVPAEAKQPDPNLSQKQKQKQGSPSFKRRVFSPTSSLSARRPPPSLSCYV